MPKKNLHSFWGTSTANYIRAHPNSTTLLQLSVAIAAILTGYLRLSSGHVSSSDFTDFGLYGNRNPRHHRSLHHLGASQQKIA